MTNHSPAALEMAREIREMQEKLEGFGRSASDAELAALIDAGNAELVARVRKCVDCCHDESNLVGGCDKADELAEIVAKYEVPE